MPEGTFAFAAMIRWGALATMVGLVVRDILKPEHDVVRQTYGDDPDGGDFVGAPDRPYRLDWLSNLYPRGAARE
jgi:hypothetical protein